MSRYQKLHEETIPFLKTKIFLLLIFIAVLIFATNLYLKSLIKIEAPEIDLGRKVVVQLPNGKEIQTYENLLVEEDGKLYYQGELNTIDVTGGIVVVEDWN
ncbi:hypothetical protein [Neobacillus sp. LXY-4]|uniref:hypothetical protein n=1 Tax=Neobacillus sp. LXY-4 TaxID=3379826 RepID=UPI003EDF2B40